MKTIRLDGNNYYLKTLLSNDVTDCYVNWLCDPEINRFLEVRFSHPTLDSVTEYVKSFNNKTKFLFGIFTSSGDRHIGNITLSVDANHSTGYFGYLVGEKEYWGKPAATEAMVLLLMYAFNSMRLRKIWGGSYATNIGSVFNFKKFGFVQEARLRKHNYDGEDLTDGLIFAIFDYEWKEKEEKYKGLLLKQNG